MDHRTIARIFSVKTPALRSDAAHLPYAETRRWPCRWRILHQPGTLLTRWQRASASRSSLTLAAFNVIATGEFSVSFSRAQDGELKLIWSRSDKCFTPRAYFLDYVFPASSVIFASLWFHHLLLILHTSPGLAPKSTTGNDWAASSIFGFSMHTRNVSPQNETWRRTR